MKNYFKFIFIIITITLSGCSSLTTKNDSINKEKNENFERALAENKCELAANNITANQKTSFVYDIAAIPGTIASWTLVSLSTGTELAVYLAGGLIGGIVICSPVIAIEAAAKSDGDVSRECVKIAASTIMEIADPKFEYSIKVMDKTEHWRCPDITEFSKAIRRIVTCYENRNTPEDLKKAKEQLSIIEDNMFQKICVTAKEKVLINEQSTRLQKK